VKKNPQQLPADRRAALLRFERLREFGRTYFSIDPGAALDYNLIKIDEVARNELREHGVLMWNWFPPPDGYKLMPFELAVRFPPGPRPLIVSEALQALTLTHQLRSLRQRGEIDDAITAGIELGMTLERMTALVLDERAAVDRSKGGTKSSRVRRKQRDQTVAKIQAALATQLRRRGEGARAEIIRDLVEHFKSKDVSERTVRTACGPAKY
jgi:hypothetical protein